MKAARMALEVLEVQPAAEKSARGSPAAAPFENLQSGICITCYTNGTEKGSEADGFGHNLAPCRVRSCSSSGAPIRSASGVRSVTDQRGAPSPAGDPAGGRSDAPGGALIRISPAKGRRDRTNRKGGRKNEV